MIYLRKNESDFRLWCKQFVPAALRDYEAFSCKELDVHEMRERYEDALLTKRQLYTLRAVIDEQHRGFLDHCLIGNEPYNNTPVEAELRREIFSVWCKIYFPNGALDEQTIDNIAMGNKLKSLRKAKELGVDHVCDLVGIAKKTLYAYEEGTCQIKLEILYRLSLLYGFNIDELLRDKNIISAPRSNR